MHVNSTGTMPAGMKTGLSGFRLPLTTEKKNATHATSSSQRLFECSVLADLNCGITSFRKIRKWMPLWCRFICLAKEQCGDGQTETHHWSWWASGSRWSLLSWWPLCRNNIQSHMAYNTLGTWSAQCISVMASYCIQPSACLLKKTCTQVMEQLSLPCQGMF